MTAFRDRVLGVVRGIPEGMTMTYARVAESAGSPGAARAVASIMARNYDSTVPCHRVIRSDGTLGRYNRGGTERKAELLRAEAARLGMRRVDCV